MVLSGVIDGIFTKSNSFNWTVLHGNDNEGYVFAQRYDSYHILEIRENFTRIGAYDFTKKENTKIKPFDAHDNWTFEGGIIKKVNELVDAVNKLMDKENKV